MGSVARVPGQDEVVKVSGQDEVVRVRGERPVAGGSTLAHLDDGTVALVRGALPGELVDADVQRRTPRRVDLAVRQVIEPSPRRTVAPCPHVARGCGGCDWQHVAVAHAVDLRAEIVIDALRRIGRLDPTTITIDTGPAAPLDSYRTTIRLARVGDQVGLRRHSSHRIVALGRCLVAHPLAQEVIDGLDPGEADELTVRVGAGTGDRLVVAAPTATGVRVPGGVDVVGLDELRAGRRAWIHEEAAGRRWRISALSFFQSGPRAADALVSAVRRGVEGVDEPARLLDLYAGVGLFAGTIGADRRVTAVERSPDAVADAKVNLHHARVVRTDVRRLSPRRAEIVVADPARAGLGAGGVAVVVAARGEVVVLVSCDAAALGRDVGALVAAGYVAERIELVDAFPGTSHIEAVTTLRRGR